MILPSWCRLSVTAIQMPQSWCRHPDATIQTQLYWYHAPNATLLMSPSRYRYSHVDILKLPSSWLHPHTATKTLLLHRKWSAKTILNKLTLFQISWKKERHKWSETNRKYFKQSEQQKIKTQTLHFHGTIAIATRYEQITTQGNFSWKIATVRKKSLHTTA